MDDVLMNNVDRHNQGLQKDGVPWGGAKKKDFVFLFALNSSLVCLWEHRGGFNHCFRHASNLTWSILL
jgi:hypothetical protein